MRFKARTSLCTPPSTLQLAMPACITHRKCTQTRTHTQRVHILHHACAQVTGALRNLAVAPAHAPAFLAATCLAALKAALRVLGGQQEVVLNVGRVLSKLSLHDQCQVRCCCYTDNAWGALSLHRQCLLLHRQCLGCVVAAQTMLAATQTVRAATQTVPVGCVVATQTMPVGCVVAAQAISAQAHWHCVSCARCVLPLCEQCRVHRRYTSHAWCAAAAWAVPGGLPLH